MNKHLSIIILSLSTIALTACSTQRGAFEGEGEGIDNGDVFIADRIGTLDTAPIQTTATPHASLTEASTAGEASSFTLQALAVQGNQNTNYTGSGSLGWSQDGETSISVATITSPAVKLDFDDTGAISAVTAYFADKSYEVSDINAGIITNGAQTDSRIATLTVDREESFGFASHYMAHISWNLERTEGDANGLLGSGKDNSYSINGSMVAGIETANDNLPDGSNAQFIGKGRGFYSHVSADIASHATIFDVSADIDFANNTARVTSSNTKQCSDLTNCTTGIGSLDFSTPELLIGNGKTGFTGNASLIADKSFTGTLDAQFYGANAQELGGIFAMLDETGGYYYGTFGAERALFNDFTFNDSGITQKVEATIPRAAPDIPTHPKASLIEAIDDTTATKNRLFTMKALAVSATDSNLSERKPTQDWADGGHLQHISIANIADSAATLTINQSGQLANIKIYLNDDISYTADASSPSKQTFTANINSENLDYIPDSQTITLARDTASLGFDANNMVYIGWNIIDKAPETGLGVTTEQRHGMMIAGIETGTIIDAGKVDFTGKGKGVYGTKNKNFDTVFTVTAKVDFDERNMLLTTETDACTDCNDFNVSTLDFADLSLGFANVGGTASVNNISKNVTLDTTLTGTLDARFYGAGTEEFGGTFALADTTTDSERYYYGAFGASRKGVAPVVKGKTTTVNTFGIVGAENTFESSTATSLTGVLILQGLAVSLSDVTNYTRYKDDAWTDTADLQIDRQITANRLTDSGVAITFGATDSVTKIFADKDYNSTNTDNITVAKSIGSFNFDYLVLVDWDKDESFNESETSLMQTITDSDGMMIAGIETVSIIGNGRVDFTGKGAGVYGTKTGNVISSQNVTFGVMAAVDFDETMVNISTDNDNDALDSILNFSISNINYGGSNVISQVLTLDTTLTGTFDARFYGGNTQEFGGTFALAENETRYYYGAFGASRNNIVPFEPSDTTALNVAGAVVAENPVTTNPSATTLTGALILQGLAVGLSDVTNYTRYKDDAWNVFTTEMQIDRQITTNRVTDSGVLIDFATDTVTTIFADKDYAVSNANVTATVEKDFGSFTANHLVLVEWNKAESLNANSETGLTQTVTDIDGMMIAGIETGTIYDAGRVNFTGKGKGVYGTKTESFDTVFAVTAKVDFTARNMLLTSTTEACTDCDNFDVSTLDFADLSLSFANAGGTASVNSISKNVTLDTTLTGTLDARFYGGGTEEFGGTFALAENDTRYYYGAFGAKKPDDVLFTTHADTPSTFNANNLTSFNDNNRNGKTGNVLQAKNSVQITKPLTGTDGSVTIDKIIGAVVKFDYANDNSGHFADGASLNIYFDDKKYSTTTAGIGTQGYIFEGATATANGTGDNPDYIILDNRSTNFGFAPNYMAYVYWRVTEPNDYETRGFGIVGFETATISNTDTIGNTAISFTGRGEGSARKNGSNTSDFVRLTVTANVNFTNRYVSLSTDNDGTDNDDLNFKGNVTYGMGENNISMNIKTQGNDGNFATSDSDGSELTGIADARFYGPDAEEFGGTFSLTSDDAGYAGYAGWFGAKPPYNLVWTTYANTPTTFNTHDLTSFNDTNRNGKTGNAFEIHSVAQATKQLEVNGAITTTKIIGAVVEFDYANDNSGNFSASNSSDSSLIFYLDDKKYSTNMNEPYEFKIYSDSNDANGNHHAPDHLQLVRESQYFGFTPTYMAYVYWRVIDANNYDTRAYGITGFETTGTNIPKTGTASFTGRGRGYVYKVSNNDGSSIRFDVTTNVNFSTRNVSIESEHDDTDNDYLDFKGDLNYVANSNIIAGSIKTKGNDGNFTPSDADGSALTGTADARFYGPNTEELGGTFSLTSETTTYIGSFGAQKQ